MFHQIEHTKTKPSSFRANLPPDSYLLEAECGVQTVVGPVHRMLPLEYPAKCKPWILAQRAQHVTFAAQWLLQLHSPLQAPAKP